MSTIPTVRPTGTTGTTETATAIHAVTETVRAIVAGEYPGTPRALSRPLPIAFLDDGRRLFLVIDTGRAGARADSRPLDQPRSWGVEVTRDGDLVGDVPGNQTAVRSTDRLSPEAAAAATRFVLEATAA